MYVWAIPFGHEVMASIFIVSVSFIEIAYIYYTPRILSKKVKLLPEVVVKVDILFFAGL